MQTLVHWKKDVFLHTNLFIANFLINFQCFYVFSSFAVYFCCFPVYVYVFLICKGIYTEFSTLLIGTYFMKELQTAVSTKVVSKYFLFQIFYSGLHYLIKYYVLGFTRQSARWFNVPSARNIFLSYSSP